MSIVSADDRRTASSRDASKGFNTIEVWALPAYSAADAASVREHELCRSLLSEDELARSLRFRFAQDAADFTLHRGHMRMLIGDALNCAPEAITFNYNEFGKPLLRACGLDFNLTHTTDFALLALSKHGPVGIDLELCTSDGLEVLELARQNFSRSEYEMLSALTNPEEQRRAFYRCWTAKEAFLKGLGTGLSRALSDFTIGLDSPRPALLSCAWNATTINDWQFVELEVPSPHVATLALRCTDTMNPSVRMRSWTTRKTEA